MLVQKLTAQVAWKKCYSIATGISWFLCGWRPWKLWELWLT